MTQYSALNDIEIVPFTDSPDCPRYWVFFYIANMASSNCIFEYTIVDMTLNNGLGGINSFEEGVILKNYSTTQYGGNAISFFIYSSNRC